MKKKVKIISVFFLILTIVLGSFFVADTSVGVKAANVIYNNPPTGEFYSGMTETKELYSQGTDGAYGKITLDSAGAITVRYLYGFTEMVIIGKACNQYNEEKTACESFANGKMIIIHISGAKYRRKDRKFYKSDKAYDDALYATQTINLFKYFEYDEIVAVRVSKPQFATSSAGQDGNTGFYEPLFCTTSGHTNCKYTGNGMAITVETRVKRIVCPSEQEGTSDYLSNLNSCYGRDATANNIKIEGTSPRSITFKGGSTSRESVITGTEYTEYNFVKVDNSGVKGAIGGVDNLVYDTIIPTLTYILIIAAALSIAVLGYQIVKSADEAQERRDKIHRLRNILIGIGIALLLLFAIEPAVKLIEGLLEE